MAFVSYYPSNVFDQLQQDIHSLYAGGYGKSKQEAKAPRVVTGHWTPAVDIKDEENRFVLRADLPGVDPAAVDISVESGVLSISGERKLEDQETSSLTRVERAFGSFNRRFKLPESADTNNIAAVSKHGVIEISVGKKAAVLPKKIVVNS